MNWNGFKGAAKRIDDIDLPKIGAQIGVGEDEIHALLDVESAGSGFDGKGWTVAVLDSGVDTSHPAFKGAIVGEACFSTSYSGEEGEFKARLCEVQTC